MAGIYLHFPFCKQACSYCDFHFSTNTKRAEEMVSAMVEELRQKASMLEDHSIKTIYFGGGSPSLLTTHQLSRLVESIHRHYKIDEEVEFTLEANPDDFQKLELETLVNMGLNRLSIGTQSFYDEDLEFMNRAHNSKEALQSIYKSKEAGIENINIDLIYGFDLLSIEKWISNLKQVIELDVWHLSAYSLTIEEGTLLHHQIKKGIISQIPEELAVVHMNILMNWAEENNWQHYEISNLSKRGKHSKHNTAYWNRIPYLGIGPSAHSFINNQRSWNVRNNAMYITKLKSGEAYFEKENLTTNNRFNEYILMALRTSGGISKDEITAEFGQRFWDEIAVEVESYYQKGLIVLNNERHSLSKKGKLVADSIASDLFITD